MAYVNILFAKYHFSTLFDTFHTPQKDYFANKFGYMLFCKRHFLKGLFHLIYQYYKNEENTKIQTQPKRKQEKQSQT